MSNHYHLAISTLKAAQHVKTLTARIEHCPILAFCGGVSGFRPCRSGVYGDYDRLTNPLMPRYVAFLRGINLGRRRPPMAELKRLFEKLGFTEVATFIASGNVVFETKTKDTRKLEAQIEKHLAAGLGYEVDTFVRNDVKVVAVLQARPFKEMSPDGGAVHVAFLKEALSPAQAKQLEACGTKVDAFAVKEREFYWQCRIRTSESEVWMSPAMKAIKLPTLTLRNLTSVRKLAAKHLVD